MLKRLLSVMLAGLLLNLIASVPAVADTQAEKDARRALKVKEGIKKLGVGEKSRVKVRMKDRTQLKGYVSAIEDDGFSLRDAKTGAATSVPYAQVAKLEGQNMSTGMKVAIGVGIGLAVLLVIAIIGVHEFREDCCF